MTSDEAALWQRARAVLELTLSQPEDTRRRFVLETCDQDPELVTEVLSLLESEGGSETFFDQLGSAIDDGLAGAEEPDPWLGRSVGPYRIVELLGRGGMGSVYKAEREGSSGEPPVAIKILRSESEHPTSRERFLRERDRLAGLDHPYIARILDTGEGESGVPFYCMDLVEGERIDHYADRHRLSVAPRIRLILKVCDAVVHAHARQVIHRDLKPSNILVRSTGEPSLVDFGIAKLLDPVTQGDPTLSLQAAAYTPGYASPEHVVGDSVSAASDVYSLGVLLYVVLAGAEPSLKRSLDRQSPAEVLQLKGEKATALAAARAATVDDLLDTFEGRLGDVLLKACQMRPERRYQTVGELVQALESYLDSVKD